MKRPMLWAAAFFALGEVTGIYAGNLKISIVFIMLICCALFLTDNLKRIILKIFGYEFLRIKSLKRTHFFVVIIAFACGLLNVRLRDNESKFSKLESVDCYGTVYRIEDNDNKCNIYIHTDLGYNIVVFNAGIFDEAGGVVKKENGYGVTDGVVKRESGYGVTDGVVKRESGYGSEDSFVKKEDGYGSEDSFVKKEDGYGSEDSQEKAYNYGDRVYIKGDLKPFEHNSNPGCFDFKNYYKSKNVFFSVDKSCVTFADGEVDSRGEKYAEESNGAVSEKYAEKRIGDVSEKYAVESNGTVREKYAVESKYSGNKKRVVGVRNPGYRYLNFLYIVRSNLKSKLFKLTDEKFAGIFCRILLGERKAVDETTRLDYQNNGMAHILAISGLHISLLFGAIYELLKRLGLNRYLSGLTGFVLLFSYALMTGFSMSTLRALCMILISLFAIYTGEYYDMPVSLSASLMVILVYNPFKILDSSVILSISAIAGVCVGQYIIKHINYFYYVNTSFKKLLASLIISASVNLIMLPVVISVYHEITLYGIFVNLLVIPLMTLVVLSGLISVLVSFISMGLASFLIKPGVAVLRLYDLICRLLYKLPLGRINIGHINIFQILIYYLMILLLLILFNKRLLKHLRNRIYKKYHIWLTRKKSMIIIGIYSGLVIFVFIGGLVFSYLLSLKEMAVFVDVGQGDGALLRSKSGVNMVIDGGSTSEKQLGKYTMIPIIKYYGMAKVDYWFISHTDTDHISGLEYILELGERSGIRIDNLVFSYGMYVNDNCQRLLKLADENGVNVIFMKAGDYIADESFRITCAHPDTGFYEGVGGMEVYKENGVGKGYGEADDSYGEDGAGRSYVEADGSYGEDGAGRGYGEDGGSYGKDGAGRSYGEDGGSYGKDGVERSHGEAAMMDINDSSLCLSYSSSKLNMLFTGDMGKDALEYMLLNERQYLLTHYDILKVPHHGSKNSINFEFYDLIDFESAVISCGENNRYGHPHEELTDLLEEYGISYYQTDKNGAVIVIEKKRK